MNGLAFGFVQALSGGIEVGEGVGGDWGIVITLADDEWLIGGAWGRCAVWIGHGRHGSQAHQQINKAMLCIRVTLLLTIQ